MIRKIACARINAIIQVGSFAVYKKT